MSFVCRDFELENVLFVSFVGRLIVFERVEGFFDERDSFQLDNRRCRDRPREDVGRG